MNIPRKDIRFFHKNGLVVAVKLPIGCKPVVFMCCGKDNRPFDAIVADIRVAADLLEEKYPAGYTKEISISYALPQLLGYRRTYISKLLEE